MQNENQNIRGQANFRLSRNMLDTLADVSQVLNMSQADFLEFLFWHFGEKAAKLSQEQVVELTSKVRSRIHVRRRASQLAGLCDAVVVVGAGSGMGIL